MATTVFDVLSRKIDEDISSAQSFLTAGSPKDYANYREVVGLIRGLEAAPQVPVSLLHYRNPRKQWQGHLS